MARVHDRHLHVTSNFTSHFILSSGLFGCPVALRRITHKLSSESVVPLRAMPLISMMIRQNALEAAKVAEARDSQLYLAPVRFV